MLRGAICEDNVFTRKKLVQLIESFGGIEIVCCAGTGKELLAFAKEAEIDLVFLDICLPDLSGIEVAKFIREQHPFSEIIFITSHDDYLKEAIELYATDYIAKPPSGARLQATLERIKQKRFANKKILELKSEDDLVFIPENDIYMIVALGRKVRICTGNHQLEANHSLKEMQSMLGPNFFRASRSYIVNVGKVTGVGPCSRSSFELLFGNSYKAYLSKSLYEDFRTRMKTVNHF